MAANLVVDIFCPTGSYGLLHDAEVIAFTLKRHYSARVRIRLHKIPLRNFLAGGQRVDVKAPADRGNVAIFIEQFFPIIGIEEYPIRAIFINPEIFSPDRVPPCVEYDVQVLAKSFGAVSSLTEFFPQKQVHCTGFTSIDPGISVENYNQFVHFRGKSPKRHTQEIFDLWKRQGRKDKLYIQGYGADCFLEMNEWAVCGSVSIFMGKMPRDQYFKEISRGGVHLCLSSSEGFGHYINEARAMAAIVFTLDAPPMNNLVNKEIGFLCEASTRKRKGLDWEWNLDLNSLEENLDKLDQVSIQDRRIMGESARDAFLADKVFFKDRLVRFLEERL